MARKASRTSFERRSDSAGVANFIRPGFTIVELLIVIVVIAILAAITIVAYNGIQNQAKAAAAQAAAKQAATKIQTYAVRNADQYPADLAAAGLSNSGDTSYQYRVDNAGSPRSFCITATTNNQSFYATNTDATPSPGACAGHAINGGELITNLANDPRFRQHSGYIAAGNGTANRESGGGLRIKKTGSSSPGIDITVAVPQSGEYAFRIEGANLSTQGAWDQSWGALGSTSSTYTGGVLKLTFNLGAGVSTLRLRIGLSPSVAVGTETVVDRLQFMAGPSSRNDTYNDGDSPGWVWNGSPNSSTSTGPLL